MSERTDEQESVPEQSSAHSSGGDDEDRVTDEDRVAERFLDLEAEMREQSATPLSEETVRRGQIVDATRVPAAEVPGAYPVAVGDGEALVLTVDLVDTGEVQTYLDWPADGEPGAESPLGRLLDTLGVAPDTLADLYGKRVLVDVVDGHYTLYTPSESPRGESAVSAILGSLGLGLTALVGSLLAAGTLSALLLVVFFLATAVALPYFTYNDAWYLRTHSDWDGGPVFWTTLAVVPLLNVVSTALYLAGRRNVTPVEA